MTALSPSAKALACAMRILAVRDHSESELQRKLAGYREKSPAQLMVGTFRRGAARYAEDAGGEWSTPPILRAEPAVPLFEPGDIDATLAYCKEHGWLDDDRFAQRYLRGRSQRGYGAQRIKVELVQKGVSRTVISTALAACDIDWFELAYQAAERKWGTTPPRNWKEKAKLQRYLQARGFSHEEIQSIYANFSH